MGFKVKEYVVYPLHGVGIIEKTCKNTSVAIISQILATTSYMMQTYENSVDLADLVV